ncbi:Uncharacterised protein [Sphingobacterium multivorum]|jgi:hypothetical protein|uniref:Uncharacterized protein n=1 Tax=Sphingobacterium multivorum TaxID=28454 RepID=A0A2X2JAP0_SPHMU|nr:hypothetical protein [Sphingobacterium multivorum]SPZ90714.1 Uncharacterised protein [Sphingobacterium multivorum]SUJ29183.1 Uncharacterised protein [Sphingobacterium multivorum]
MSTVDWIESCIFILFMQSVSFLFQIANMINYRCSISLEENRIESFYLNAIEDEYG